MPAVHVRRVQYAVGHGGFHTGNLSLTNGPGELDSEPSSTVTYVYDCGNEDRALMDGILLAHAADCSGLTDILFVSHLHSDHVSGLDRLMAIAPAATVVVPYLEAVDLAIFILGEVESGRLSSLALDYVRDPASWWLRRGAGRVIFLEPGAGDEQGRFTISEPDPPPEPSGDETRTHKGRLRANERLISPRRARDGLVAVRTGTNNGAQTILAGTGSSISVEYRDPHWDYNHSADWLLVPYVHPVGTAARANFRKALANIFKVRSSSDARMRLHLAAHVANPSKRKVLVKAYSDHIGRGQNRISLSLYSGPATPVPHSGWELEQSSWYSSPNSAIGWLSAGDAELARERYRKPWMHFYEPFGPSVANLTLPHHGSWNNFHPEIIGFPGLVRTFATTVPKRGRIVGLNDTLHAIRCRGLDGHVVDDEATNSVILACRRVLA